MKLKDLAGLDNTFNDLSRYAKSPFIFNQQQENYMFRETSTKDLEEKLKSLEAKLDLVLAKLDPNPEDLLSTSEINMMKSWRTQANDIDSSDS